MVCSAVHRPAYENIGEKKALNIKVPGIKHSCRLWLELLCFSLSFSYLRLFTATATDEF